jgi:hypothetical protein
MFIVIGGALLLGSPVKPKSVELTHASAYEMPFKQAKNVPHLGSVLRYLIIVWSSPDEQIVYKSIRQLMSSRVL